MVEAIVHKRHPRIVHAARSTKQSLQQVKALAGDMLLCQACMSLHYAALRNPLS
jgi:hypothetical protein